MRFALLLLLLTAACALPPAAASEGPAPSPVTVETLASSTVALVEDDFLGIEVRPYCSGVWIAPSVILTAQHCVSDLVIGSEVFYVIRDDVFGPGDLEARKSIAVRRGQLLAADEDHDLALVYAWAAPLHTVTRTSHEAIPVGSVVRTMGTPLGLWWSYSSGHISAVRKTDAGLDIVWLQTTAPISPGNSGGGLFDEYGRLLGIASRSYIRGQNLNLYVHRIHIEAFLKKHEIVST
jgi:S1-C subfamily serine protease